MVAGRQPHTIFMYVTQTAYEYENKLFINLNKNTFFMISNLHSIGEKEELRIKFLSVGLFSIPPLHQNTANAHFVSWFANIYQMLSD